MKAHFETVQTTGNIFWKWKRILKLSKLKDTNFENESAFWNCPNQKKQILKMKAHFENVQTKGHRFWKWKHILKLSKLKETDFENASAFWNCPN
jgi:hypothetical protein